jgi:hypothetical protein
MKLLVLGYASMSPGMGLGLGLAGLWSHFEGWVSDTFNRWRSQGIKETITHFRQLLQKWPSPHE